LRRADKRDAAAVVPINGHFWSRTRDGGHGRARWGRCRGNGETSVLTACWPWKYRLIWPQTDSF